MLDEYNRFYRCAECEKPLVATSSETELGTTDDGDVVSAPLFMVCPKGHGKLKPIPHGAQSSRFVPAFPSSLAGCTIWDGQVTSVECRL